MYHEPDHDFIQTMIMMFIIIVIIIVIIMLSVMEPTINASQSHNLVEAMPAEDIRLSCSIIHLGNR